MYLLENLDERKEGRKAGRGRENFPTGLNQPQTPFIKFPILIQPAHPSSSPFQRKYCWHTSFEEYCDSIHGFEHVI